MRRSVQRWRGVRLLAVLTLVATALTAGAGTASAHSKDRRTTVPVVLTPDGVEVAKAIDGRVLTFDVSTTSEFGILQVFAPKRGKTVDDVLAALRVQLEGASPDAVARSTRELTRNADWFGGVDVTAETSASFTVRLDRGTYYLLDIASGFGGTLGPVSRVTVSGDGSGSRPDADARIEMRGTDEGPGGADHGHAFRAPDVMPAEGTVEVRNQDDVIHFVTLIPLQPGTTRDEIAELLGQEPSEEDPGPFLEGPSASMNVLSPGGRASLHYDLPEGTYLLACFIADEKVLSKAHFDLGMFEVVELE